MINESVAERQIAEANRSLCALRKQYEVLDKRHTVLPHSRFGEIIRKLKDKLQMFRLWIARKIQTRGKKQQTVAAVSDKSPQFPEEKSSLPSVTSPELLPSITVMIPTYKKNDTLAYTIQSILEQDYPAEKIEIILSVNGKDVDYVAYLTQTYKDDPRIRVIHTPTSGAGAGRNNAKRYLRTDFCCYLDDDDYFTKGYLKELGSYATDEVDVVCGRTITVYSDGTVDEDTYLNNFLRKFGGRVYDEPWPLTPFFSSVCMKLYRTTQLQNVWGDFDETRPYTEDVCFWVENVYKSVGKIVAVSADSKEAHVRRMLDDSRSRPSREKAFEFFVPGRIILIDRFAKHLREDRSMEYKTFIRGKINACYNRMYRYYQSCSPEEQQDVIDFVEKYDSLFLHKSRIVPTRAIAFCHDFSQTYQTDGYVVTKRLDQISQFAGTSLNWTVISGGGRSDAMWENFYAKYRYTDRHVISGYKRFDEVAQRAWAKKAFDHCAELDADYIYSGSKCPGSHAAALEYKRTHPTTCWIAEFAEPLTVGANGRPKKSTFWKELETAVFNEADKIVFSSENQREYLQAHQDTDIGEKALVWQPPVIDSLYAQIVPTKNLQDPDAIHIGYFDSFHKKTIQDEFLPLLTNPRIHLHIFAETTPQEAQLLHQLCPRIHLLKPVTLLEMLSLARKMDYLYVSDLPFDGPCSPYLPERLADYLSVGRPVLAKVYPNTPTNRLEHERLIKLQSVEPAFALSLQKTYLPE